MEKIQKIKKIQIFTIIFMVSVLLNQGGLLFPQNAILATGGSIVSIGAYVLLWVSYGMGRSLNINSKRYLLLALLLTVVSMIISVTGSVWVAIELGKAASEGAQITTAEDLSRLLPNYKMFTTIMMLVGTCVNIIYIGISAMVYMDNKKLSLETQKEVDEAYNS
ncbi:MAG: hypothetical protein ACRC6X_02155 [Culicoidibacterales bacterium]